MKTYHVIQVVEMSIRHTIRANNADEANEIATDRSRSTCHAISRSRKSVEFGDITDDYVPARDDDAGPGGEG